MESLGKNINWVVIVIAVVTAISSIVCVNNYTPQPEKVKEVVVKDMAQDMKIVIVFQENVEDVKKEIQEQYPKYIIFDLYKTENYYIVTLAKEEDLNGFRN